MRERAQQLGVETSYWDVQGQLHHTTEATLRAIVDVLEADAAGTPTEGPPVAVARGGERVAVGAVPEAELHLEDGATVTLAVTAGAVTLPAELPIGCHRLLAGSGGAGTTTTVVVPPPTMPRTGRLGAGSAGLFVPAYALWESDAPLPSFRHLADLARALAGAGIDVLSTLPLYAAFLDEPFDPSPYAPVSRLHWNELYLDDASLPPAPQVPSGALIDWPVLARRRRRQLLEAAGGLDPATAAAVDAFAATRPDVADFARFSTERAGPDGAGFPAALVTRSYRLAQYLANQELADVEGAGGAVLAVDLPIGSHPAGYEMWAHRSLFAEGMSVGAPPDEFFAEGQNWGFAPPLPGAGRRSGHDLWRRLVARAGEHASVLRVDHVMGVQRLWWIPADASAIDGAYVRYPREELLAVIATEAHRSATTIIGEDLGTVSDEVREALHRWDVIGMYEELFHLRADELPRPPRRSVAGLRTHDMPAFAAGVADVGLGALDGYRRRLEGELGHPVAPDVDDLLDGVLERLARSDADVVIADLDDLIGETAPHNVPGQVLPTTWRRRLPEPTSAVLARPRVQERLALLAARGDHGEPSSDPPTEET